MRKRDFYLKFAWKSNLNLNAITMQGKTKSKQEQILLNFEIGGTPVDIIPLGDGLINDTYKVMMPSGKPHDYVLQRINHHIFTDVELLQHNIDVVTSSRQPVRRISTGKCCSLYLPRRVKAIIRRKKVTSGASLFSFHGHRLLIRWHRRMPMIVAELSVVSSQCLRM